ncbi:CheY-like chemotaxis protein [Azospirillum sp. OGB3]|uniref:response regulator n=1 Tax=Azospirillum sp. OGB3 TaxID=2587012 RepID=UPI001605D91A|nr:response regulator [Azospirillum sp. OGB3]MBB3264344.1 CheY-like chemotaxis protein [Azospirillum sp. OGB3]
MADILVVDDDPVSLTIVTKILEKEGNTVTGCSNARAAIEALTFHEFDLLVTDLIMPDHDGFEVIQAARNLRSGLRIIVLSGIDERVPPELTMQALTKLGVARMVRKPIKPAVLASEVLAVLIGG